MQNNNFFGFNRLVIKIGSALLINNDSTVNKAWLKSIANEINGLLSNKVEILIVSSGAVAIGCGIIGKKRTLMNLNELQAAAAMGQAQLVIEWQDALKEINVKAAQILLTPDDTENRKRFLNSKELLNLKNEV